MIEPVIAVGFCCFMIGFGTGIFSKDKDEEDLLERIEELEQQNAYECGCVSNLQKDIEEMKDAIDYLGGIKCSKCGEYHHRNYICWNCGYDRTKEEL